MRNQIVKSVGIETLVITLLASVLSAIASYLANGDAFSWGGLVAVVAAALGSALTSYVRTSMGVLTIPPATEVPPETPAPVETKPGA